MNDQGKTLECTPSLLALTILSCVEKDLAGARQTLKIIARETQRLGGHNATDAELEEGLSRFLSFEKETALFRQLCLFYDALWYNLLLPKLIDKTRRVPSDSIEAYRATVRQKSMELLATAEYLPEEWRKWGTEAYSTDMQADFNFYMHGVVPPSQRDEFDLILNFTRTRGNGHYPEMLAWLHMRTREIIGLVDKKEHLLTHATLFNSQARFTTELIEYFMSNVVPIPE